jgi:hypothetical protein
VYGDCRGTISTLKLLQLLAIDRISLFPAKTTWVQEAERINIFFLHKILKGENTQYEELAKGFLVDYGNCFAFGEGSCAGC